jgi:3-hydroxybutyryl-CoA dehydrogenase
VLSLQKRINKSSMKIVLLANDETKGELLSGVNTDAVTVITIKEITEFALHPEADAFFDLAFEMNPERIELLNKLTSKPVFINSVSYTISETGYSFIRLNGWPTFLKRDLLEAASPDDLSKTKAEQVMAALNKKIEWVPDIAGFISARVVSMIVNEAWFALEEEVSTKKEIDTAMKLGTNYPNGPFEWGEKIGEKNIYELLTKLSKTNSRYIPAALLKKEATS